MWPGHQPSLFFYIVVHLFKLCVVVMLPISPGFPLTVNQEVVKQEENTLLDVPSRDFEESSAKQQVCTNICQIGSLLADEIARFLLLNKRS